MGQGLTGTREQVALQHELRKSLYTEIAPELVKPILELHEEGEIRCLALSPKADRILTANGRVMKIYDSDGGEEVMRFKHRSNINSCKFSPCGNYVLAASNNKDVKVWDISEGDCKNTWRTRKVVDKCGWSPDGKLVWTTTWSPELKVWDPTTGKKVIGFKAHGTIRCCRFLKDSISLLVGGDGGEVNQFQISDNPVPWFRNVGFDVDGMTLSPDENFMIFYGDHDACLMDKQEFLIPWGIKSVRSIGFSHRDDVVITCTRRTLGFWAPFASSELGKFEAHKQMIVALEMTKMRDYLLTLSCHVKSGTNSSTLKLWHNETMLIDGIEKDILDLDINVIDTFTKLLGDAKGWIKFFRVGLGLNSPWSLDFALRVFGRNFEKVLNLLSRIIESEEWLEQGEDLLKLTLQVVCRNPTVTPETIHLLAHAKKLVKKVNISLHIQTLINEAAGSMLEKTGPFIADFDLTRFLVNEIIQSGPGLETFIQQYIAMILRFIEQSGQINDDVDELRDVAKEMIKLLTNILTMFQSNSKIAVGGVVDFKETQNINPLDPESPIINCILHTLDYHIELSQWVVINAIIQSLTEQNLFHVHHRRKLRQKAHTLLTNLNDEGKATYERFLQSPDSSLLSEVKNQKDDHHTLTQQKFHSKLDWYHGDDEAVDLIKFNRCIRPLKGNLPLGSITRSSRKTDNEGTFIDGSGHAYYTQFMRLCAGVHQRDFEAKLKQLFPGRPTFVHLNSLKECFELSKAKCKHKPQPKAAHLLDTISTLLVFETPKQLLEAQVLVEDNFDVLKTVNCFRKDTDISEIFFGFRMLRTYVLLEKESVFHIGEISLTLQEFFNLNTAAARFRSIRDLDFASGAKISQRSFYRSASFAVEPGVDIFARGISGESQL